MSVLAKSSFTPSQDDSLTGIITVNTFKTLNNASSSLVPESPRTLRIEGGTLDSGEPIVCPYQTTKPWIGMPLTILMLVVFAPIILFAMLLVRITSRGPAIYTQKRLGLK